MYTFLILSSPALLFLQQSSLPYPVVEFTGGTGLLFGTRSGVSADSCNVVSSVREDLFNATAVLLAVCWTFGFQYPRKIKRTLAFLDHYEFGLPDCRGLPVPAFQLKTEIDNDYLDYIRFLQLPLG